MGVDFSNHRPETLYSTGGYSTTSSEGGLMKLSYETVEALYSMLGEILRWKRHRDEFSDQPIESGDKEIRARGRLPFRMLYGPSIIHAICHIKEAS